MKKEKEKTLFLTVASCGYWDNGYVLELLHIILLRSKYDVISSDGVVNTCSMSCAEVDWESSHSLLCTGESSDSTRREAPLKFIKHANVRLLPYGCEYFLTIQMCSEV